MAAEGQLIIQDFAGAHNADLQKTSARLIKGGSWKKQRTICIIPAANSIPAKVYLNHLNIAYPPNNGVFRILALGMEVGDAYSKAIEQILAQPELKDWEYLFCYEHDNTIPSDGVLKLMEAMEEHPEYSAISGLYFTKGPEGVAQIWGDPKDTTVNFRPQPPRPNEIVECCGTGMGAVLFRLSMFKDDRLRKPWFRTTAGVEGCSTQDLHFWSDARKFGYRCAVDCRVRVGHYDHIADFTW
jgi:hypothetical protein